MQLFHFDIESKPILEVLVGKTVEQSLLEVMEEEELSNLRMQQCQFEELRNAELVEQQRLEEQERRHREEKVGGEGRGGGRGGWRRGGEKVGRTMTRGLVDWHRKCSNYQVHQCVS